MKRFILVLLLAPLNAPLFLLLYKNLFCTPAELRLAVSAWFGPYYNDLEDWNKQGQESKAVVKLVVLVLLVMALLWVEIQLLLLMGV